VKSQEILKLLDKSTVFSTKQVRLLTNSSSGYTKQIIHRWKKKGTIFEIERGKYTTHDDPFLIASRIVWPSYISLWSALRYHNLTEQVPHAVWVVTTQPRKKAVMRILETDIYFTVTKPQYFFGYEKAEQKGLEFFVADPEKAIIDSLLFRKVSVPEVYEMIRINKRTVSYRQLMRYALKINNTALIKRIGYMLEKIGYAIDKGAEKAIYSPMTRLEPNLPPKGPVNTKWKIVENVIL
jgi:predicted transcriptional regulator of viral defense system